ncbi:DNA-binding protein [Bifidobacterium sp. 82T24]|uniref:FitA-like ribbon-helix-helix domain-containing protein n=1 Tax=Bifidobacterium pluvialisilvae TaxID=2834436 RepID=UPI001C567895|nr:DNA-binding protein [Bifidobacterium pluvialisilvae]MBW3087471.1 DNA-binding protein [Bifidobacterium pluvialisilvae]
MGTMTIRRLDDDVIEQFKTVAKANNRSAEAEARSLIEDYIAGRLVQRDMEDTNFYDRVRSFMGQHDIEGFTEEEFSVPEREHGCGLTGARGGLS